MGLSNEESAERIEMRSLLLRELYFRFHEAGSLVLAGLHTNAVFKSIDRINDLRGEIEALDDGAPL